MFVWWHSLAELKNESSTNIGKVLNRRLTNGIIVFRVYLNEVNCYLAFIFRVLSFISSCWLCWNEAFLPFLFFLYFVFPLPSCNCVVPIVDAFYTSTSKYMKRYALAGCLLGEKIENVWVRARVCLYFFFLLVFSLHLW